MSAGGVLFGQTLRANCGNNLSCQISLTVKTTAIYLVGFILVAVLFWIIVLIINKNTDKRNRARWKRKIEEKKNKNAKTGILNDHQPT